MTNSRRAKQHLTLLQICDARLASLPLFILLFWHMQIHVTVENVTFENAIPESCCGGDSDGGVSAAGVNESAPVSSVKTYPHQSQDGDFATQT